MPLKVLYLRHLHWGGGDNSGQGNYFSGFVFSKKALLSFPFKNLEILWKGNYKCFLLISLEVEINLSIALWMHLTISNYISEKRYWQGKETVPLISQAVCTCTQYDAFCRRDLKLCLCKSSELILKQHRNHQPKNTLDCAEWWAHFLHDTCFRLLSIPSLLSLYRFRDRQIF